MDIREFIKNNITVLDGGLGTLLQKKGIAPGERPEMWNITHPDIISGIHKDYFDAGSNIICLDTFGANTLNFDIDTLDKIIKSAVENGRKAQRETISEKETFIAFDMGSLGRLLKPYGDFDFEDAVRVFGESVKIADKYGVDLFFIETMNDSYETKAAVLGVKENSDKPLFVSNAYGEDGKLMTGATPDAMVAMLEGMGVDAIGVNCSLGPKALSAVIDRYIEISSLPVLFKPNAGLPQVKNGETVFDVSSDEFSSDVAEKVEKGVRLCGGCCGTTPEYICKLNEKIINLTPFEIENKNLSVVTSYTKSVYFGNEPVLIGERINPTGKKRFKQALIENDIGYILNEGIEQQDRGVHILDVNVGLPDIDEVEMLKNAVCELQTVSDLPLQIDSSDYIAVEKALRRYNGKAMINSVNGKKESMDNIFPLVKKYGGVLVCLTLDEKGIPDTVKGRVEIAERIIAEAEKYGIEKKNLIFDSLAMTVSASSEAAIVTIGAIKEIKEKLNCNTVLGVSNISFGLPERDYITSTFFVSALNSGLSAAIMNPYSFDMMKAYYTYKVLNNMDENCGEYINFCSCVQKTESITAQKTEKDGNFSSDLQKAIIKGLKKDAEKITALMLKENNPLDIINNEIIPALNIVGEGFENKTVFLPQLLTSAETASVAFEKIKSSVGKTENKNENKFVIATVKGDIHDIGKNIVKLILENYGFDVIDLGKDVEPEAVVNAVIENNAKTVGLSALMTTTVPAMEETIKLLNKKCPDCKTIVGGAVLNKEYAEKIGADYYAADAMETVRYAQELR